MTYIAMKKLALPRTVLRSRHVKNLMGAADDGLHIELSHYVPK